MVQSVRLPAEGKHRSVLLEEFESLSTQLLVHLIDG